MGTMSLPKVIMFADGACSPNPGVGGWAAILMTENGKNERCLSGAEHNTTNNRMELTSVISGLEALNRSCSVCVHTDSQYVSKAFTERWIEGWIARGWKKVKNKDLWKRLFELTRIHQVNIIWVRGHADNELNNRCDELAVAARIRLAERIK